MRNGTHNKQQKDRVHNKSVPMMAAGTHTRIHTHTHTMETVFATGTDEEVMGGGGGGGGGGGWHTDGIFFRGRKQADEEVVSPPRCAPG